MFYVRFMKANLMNLQNMWDQLGQFNLHLFYFFVTEKFTIWIILQLT